jgi:RecJ-like exonuclease
MQEKLEGILLKAKRITDTIKSTPGTIRVISHYDADGITSAAIMVSALFREGRDFHLTIIKQLSEEIIQKLAEEKPRIIVFLDLGSGHLDAIQKYLNDSVVVISDHHQIQGTEISKNLLHLNPVNFGITEDVSGSGTTYLLARVMSDQNKDLSELGIIGAIGDSQMGSIGPEWGLSGLNKEILADAVNSGKIKLQKGLRLWGRYTRPIHKALEYSMDPNIPGISGSESGAVQFLQELKIELKREDGSWRTLADLTPEEQQKLASGIITERIRDNHIR